MPHKVGLQRDSVSNLGNNLFGFVLGSALAIISLIAYGGALTSGIGNNGMMQLTARLLPLLGIILLVFYYLIDWYDLNLAVYIDEFVGRVQVSLYVIAALIIASLPPLVLSGKIEIAALLAVLYFPLANSQRNKLFHDIACPVDQSEQRTYGQKEGAVKILKYILWGVSLGTLIMAVWSLIEQSNGAKLAVSIALLMLWLFACILKILRSVYFLQVLYERRLHELGL